MTSETLENILTARHGKLETHILYLRTIEDILFDPSFIIELKENVKFDDFRDYFDEIKHHTQSISKYYVNNTHDWVERIDPEFIEYHCLENGMTYEEFESVMDWRSVYDIPDITYEQFEEFCRSHRQYYHERFHEILYDADDFDEFYDCLCDIQDKMSLTLQDAVNYYAVEYIWKEVEKRKKEEGMEENGI